jgi:hypothetical protein
MNTIKEEWLRFSKALIEGNPSDEDLETVKLAYYGGIYCILGLIKEGRSLKTKNKIKIMEGWEKELNDFLDPDKHGI